MLYTKALKFITASMASVLIYIAVPIGYFLDFFILKTQISAIEITGACIIVLSNVAIGMLLYMGWIR